MQFHDTFLYANSTTGNFSILPILLLIASLSNGEKHIFHYLENTCIFVYAGLKTK